MSKNTIVADGELYVRHETGNRCVVVIDRGWIYAGDVEEIDIGGRAYIQISNAVWVLSWRSIGFDGVLKNPDSDSVTIRKMDHSIQLPVDAELFRIPVRQGWGL